MSYEAYRILHIVGLALLLLGTGGMLFQPKDAPKQKLPAVLHGMGLLVLVVAGFGLMAKPQLGMSAPHDWSAWLILKMVVWFLAAVMPTLIRAGTVPRAAGWVIALALVATAAWLGIQKPTFG